MKRLMFILFSLAGAGTALHAQTGANRSYATSSASHEAKGTHTHAKSKQVVQLSNRKIYHWKNGQRATPTGHQAAGTNTDEFVSLHRDSSAQASGKQH